MLNQASGFFNTFILITSSYFVVKGVKSIKSMTQENYKELNIKASKWLLFAILCGLIFLVVKVTEFSHIFGEGINLSTNTFFMFYLLLTGFHFMHVLNYSGFESGASYWHMVDLLWIILFPLIYIIR